MPSKKRVDAAKAWRSFEEANKRMHDAGQLHRTWSPNEVGATNDDLGGKTLGAYSYRALRFDRSGEPIAPASWTNPKPDYRAGAEAMAENARDNRTYIKQLAGNLWGQTGRIPEIRQLVLDDLHRRGESSHSVPVSDRTLRRYFKLDP